MWKPPPTDSLEYNVDRTGRGKSGTVEIGGFFIMKMSRCLFLSLVQLSSSLK